MKTSSKNPFAGTLTRLRLSLIAVGVFSFALNLLALTVPLHMLHVYDHVLTSRSVATLLFLTLLAIGLLAALGLLEFFRSRILVRIGLRLDDELSDRLFSAAVAERLSAPSNNPGQPLRDLETLRSFVSGSALLVFFDAPWAPVFVVVIFLLHPLLGAVAIAGAAVLLLMTLLNEWSTRRLHRVAIGDTIAATGFADTALRNAEVIHAMGMAPAVIARWQQNQRSAVGGNARIADRSGNFMAIAKFWRPLLQIMLLSIGAWLAIGNVITPGVMIAASIIMARALAPVEGAIASWRGFLMARSAYGRLRDILARHRAPPERMPLPNLKGEVLISNLFVAPPGILKPVLKGISLSLSPGDALGVIGPSASGKSTLARALVGAWPVVSGEIRLDGATLANLDRVRVGRQIGYLPQDVELFDGTVAENIARFGDPDPERVLDAARLAGLHEAILRLPLGYDTRIGAAGEALSGGQRQRIALARAVHGRPALVILDEPNANLDAEGEDALLAALATLKARRVTLIVIAHRPTILAAVDRILVLRDGAVDMFRPRADVLAKFSRLPPAPREATPIVAKIGGRQ